MILTGKELGIEPAPMPTMNPTWTDTGANPGLRGERPATNGLSYGTSLFQLLLAL
jgi:hypothetical protein